MTSPPRPITDADTLPPGQFTGGLKTVPGSGFASMVDSVEDQHLELKNPNQIPKTNNSQLQNVLKDQAKIAQLQQKIATARTARQQLPAVHAAAPDGNDHGPDYTWHSYLRSKAPTSSKPTARTSPSMPRKT